MAQATLSSFANSVAVVFENDAVKAFNRRAPTAMALETALSPNPLKWNARVVDASASGSLYLAETADFSTPNFDTLAPASLGFARCVETFQLTSLAIASAKGIQSPEELRDLVGEEVREAADRMATRLDKAILADAYGANEIHGFGHAFAATGSYAGIDPNTYPLWSGTVLANGGTPRDLTLDLLEQALSDVMDSGGMPAEIIVDGYSERVIANLIGNRAYNRDPLAATLKLSGGYMGLDYNGVPIRRNLNMPAGRIYVRSDNVKIRFLDPQTDSDQGVMTLANGLPVAVVKLPNAGSGQKYGLEAFWQLQVRNRAHHAIIKDLNVQP